MITIFKRSSEIIFEISTKMTALDRLLRFCKIPFPPLSFEPHFGGSFRRCSIGVWLLVPALWSPSRVSDSLGSIESIPFSLLWVFLPSYRDTFSDSKIIKKQFSNVFGCRISVRFTIRFRSSCSSLFLLLLGMLLFNLLKLTSLKTEKIINRELDFSSVYI